jgi:hypothetical protein
MQRASHALRSRIALALGLAVLVPLTNAPDTQAAPPTGVEPQWCTSPEEPTTTTDTGSGGSGGTPAPTCAPAGFVEPQAVGAPVDTGSCAVTGLLAEGVFDPATGSCCYAAATACGGSGGGKVYDCGCYGRPLVVEARAMLTDHCARADWADAPTPWVAALSPAQREHLARYWLDNARAEHSSVAGFAKLVLDLVALGAPADLVHRAQVAGADELRHARACYGLASAYAGTRLGPRGIVSPPIHLAQDLASLAVATAREGCIGETIAAHLAAALAERATDPAVVEVLRAIADEEGAHAELSWAILAWAIAEGGDPVREAVAPVFAEVPHLSGDGAPDDPRLVAHGLVSDHEKAAICEEGHRAVVGVLAGALLAA